MSVAYAPLSMSCLAQSAKARAVLEEENERLNTRLAEVSMWDPGLLP